MSKQIYLFSTSSHPDTISINPLNIKILKPVIDFSLYDYLIITSKQASNVLKQYRKADFTDKKALCVSEKSALAFEEIGGSILEIGAGYGDNLEKIIKKYPQSVKWLYLRANEVASEFAKICKKDAYSVDEIVVYETSCSVNISNLSIEPEATLIFTSPSSVICFLKTNSISSLSKVIVIGKTTAKALPKAINYRISQERTIQSCIDLV